LGLGYFWATSRAIGAGRESSPFALFPKTHRIGRPLCLENPRPEGAECSLTESASSPFHAEPEHTQKKLVNVLYEVAHPEGGVIAKVRSTNESLLSGLATRAQQIDDLLGRLEKQVWAIWLPVVASAALALGFALGTWFANERQEAPETPGTVQSQQELLAPEVSPQTLPQRRLKHH
jgi:hypothetical protein